MSLATNALSALSESPKSQTLPEYCRHSEKADLKAADAYRNRLSILASSLVFEPGATLVDIASDDSALLKGVSE